MCRAWNGCQVGVLGNFGKVPYSSCRLVVAARTSDGDNPTAGGDPAKPSQGSEIARASDQHSVQVQNTLEEYSDMLEKLPPSQNPKP